MSVRLLRPHPGEAKGGSPPGVLLFPMKPSILVVGTFLVTGTASASFPIGRGELSANLALEAAYDSNLFVTRAATADYFVTLSPRLSFIRKSGRLNLGANAGMAFVRFADQTQLDADNLDADFSLRTADSDGRNYSGSFLAGYRESSEANADLNARIKSQTTSVGGKAELAAGPRIDLAAGFDFSSVERDVASDQELLSTLLRFDYKEFLGPTSFRLVGTYDEARSSGKNIRGAELNQTSYSATAGLGRRFYHDIIQARIGAGYRVLKRSRAETVTGDDSQSGPLFTASLDGPFLPQRYFPKVKSRASLTYENSTTPGVNDTGTKTLAGALNVEWQARANTLAGFSVTRSQRLSADDLTVVSTALLANVDQILRYNLTANLSAGYNWDTFRGTARADETLHVSAGLSYTFARSWSAGATYRLNSVTSTQRSSTYDRHEAGLRLAYQF